MKTINLVQGTDEWLAWRANGVGASEVAALFNNEKHEVCCVREDTGEVLTVIVEGSPYLTPYQLWLLKTGREQAPDLSGNPHVQRGKRMEAPARDCANAHYSEMALPVTAEHDDCPLVRASFDGIFGAGDILEIKVPSEKNYAFIKANGPPAHYVPQVAQQMAVKGADVAHLFVYADDENYIAFEFRREGQMKTLIESIVPTIRAFWAYVTKDVETNVDPDRDVVDLSESEAFIAQAEAWSEAKEKEDQAKALMNEASKARKAAEKELASLAGDNKLVCGGGIRLTRFEKRGAVDYKKVIDAFAPEVTDDDLERFRRAPSQGITVTRSKE